MDHTADVQLHAWGASLEEAFESVAVAMFNYMTDVSRVHINEEQTITLELEEADREKLLFVFLDDLLYHFLEEERLVCADVQIVAADWTKNKLTVKVRYNAPTPVCNFVAYILPHISRSLTLTACPLPQARGETFDPAKHEKGTEVKAITYSATRIEERDGQFHVYVIVDI